MGDEVKQDAVVLILNKDSILQAIHTAQANLNHLLSGQQAPNGNTDNLKVSATQQLEVISRARTSEENARKEFEYWSNEVSRLLFSIRTPTISVTERDKLSAERENAELMRVGAQIKLEDSSLERFQAERRLTSIKNIEQTEYSLAQDPEYWKQQLQILQQALQHTEIISDTAGRVTQVLVSVGSLINPNQPIMDIVPLSKDSYPITVSANAEDITKFHIGQQVSFRSELETVPATITSIIPLGSSVQLLIDPDFIPEFAPVDGEVIVEIKP